MVIMVDVDNVLNNLQEVVVNLFNQKYGTQYTLNTFTKYNVSECLSKEDAINMTKMYDEPGIYDNVNPIDGARTVLEKLIRAGHSVYLVTDANPSIYEEKVNWIMFHFPCIDRSNIICMKHKWLFRCDAMIEDNLNNLLGGYHYDRICLDYPWNTDIRDEVYDIHRAQNWNNVLDIINKLNKEWSDAI